MREALGHWKPTRRADGTEVLSASEENVNSFCNGSFKYGLQLSDIDTAHDNR